MSRDKKHTSQALNLVMFDGNGMILLGKTEPRHGGIFTNPELDGKPSTPRVIDMSDLCVNDTFHYMDPSQLKGVSRRISLRKRYWAKSAPRKGVKHRHTIIVSPLSAHHFVVDYKESDSLTNIDGYIVSDGARVNIVLRSSLNCVEKEEGMKEMLRIVESGEPAVHTWKIQDDENIS